MDVKEAIETISTALKTDHGYWISWQANIAMAFKDEWQRTVENGGLPRTIDQIHEIANKSACDFLRNLCRSEGENEAFNS